MDALGQIDIIDETADLAPRIFKVSIVVKRYFFFFDGSDEALSIAVLFGVSDFGHTDLTLDLRQAADIIGGGILQTLI